MACPNRSADMPAHVVDRIHPFFLYFRSAAEESRFQREFTPAQSLWQRLHLLNFIPCFVIRVTLEIVAGTRAITTQVHHFILSALILYLTYTACNRWPLYRRLLTTVWFIYYMDSATDYLIANADFVAGFLVLGCVRLVAGVMVMRQWFVFSIISLLFEFKIIFALYPSLSHPFALKYMGVISSATLVSAIAAFSFEYETRVNYLLRESLRQSEEHSSRIMESCPDGLLVRTHSGIAYQNHAAMFMCGGDVCRMFQKSALKHYTITPESIVDSVDKMLEESCASFSSLEVECSDTRHDQKTYIEFTGRHIRWWGQPAVLLVFRDISERKIMESTRQAEKAKNLLLATVSHELRTPLNGIMGSLELLAGCRKRSDSEKRLLSIATVSGNLLLTLIDDILDFSKLEAHKFVLNCRAFSVSQVVRHCLQMISFQASQKPVSTSFEIESGLPDSVLGDANRLKQVLVNLLSNAIKFTTEGSIKIKVSSSPGSGLRSCGSLPINSALNRTGDSTPTSHECGHDPAPPDSQLNQLNTKSESSGEVFRLYFAVVDTGVGISDQNQKKLFKLFGTLSETSEMNTQGTGFGLYVCKQICTRMGGTLGVSSSPGKGSTFFFDILVRQNPDTQRSILREPELWSDDDENGIHPAGSLSRRDGEKPSHQTYKDVDLTAAARNGCETHTEAPSNSLRPLWRDTMSEEVFTNFSFASSFPDKDGGNHAHVMTHGKEQPKMETVAASSAVHVVSDIWAVGTSSASSSPQQPTLPSRSTSYVSLSSTAAPSPASTSLTSPRSPHQTELTTQTAQRDVYVLIVDDNLFNQTVLQAMLPAHIKFDTASDGQQAVDKFRQNPLKYSIIFMDCQMPVMDGYVATQEINKMQTQASKHGQKSRAVPIVALTAFAGDTERDKCFAAGMVDYASKPMSRATLSKLLQKWLPSW
eukprot:GILK01012374.1.p1 GENE.GILK01012374.1~~GILK01012374.1.p1  ORF type:complete len:930 (+),score=104.12 GILK01012374.1:82-2871(+)